MNTILQDILGLFTRKKIITSKQLKDNDYLAVAEIKSRSVGAPSERDVRLIKASDLSPAPEEKLIDKYVGNMVNPALSIDLSESDYFVLDMTAIIGMGGPPGGPTPLEITLLPAQDETFVGTKQLVLKYGPLNNNLAMTWINVKWSNGVDPVWALTDQKYDVVTITGHARDSGVGPQAPSYLGAASVNH